MKKILFAVTVLLFCGVAKAERTITLNKVDTAIGKLYFGTSVDVGTTTFYAPLAFTADVTAVSSEGFRLRVSSSAVLGALKETPYTAKESWNLLPAALKPIFKELYLEAINADLSE